MKIALIVNYGSYVDASLFCAYCHPMLCNSLSEVTSMGGFLRICLHCFFALCGKLLESGNGGCHIGMYV